MKKNLKIGSALFADSLRGAARMELFMETAAEKISSAKEHEESFDVPPLHVLGLSAEDVRLDGSCRRMTPTYSLR